jgi:cytochrome c oxidase assembly factor CtaG
VPPKLTLTTAFTQWVADPVMMGLVVMLLAGYISGVWRVRRHGGTWAAGRVWAFCFVGAGGLVYATMGWLGVYQGYLFYARAGQTVMLVLLVPLFLAMGRPITLAITAFPALDRPVRAVIGGRVARVLTFPVITTLALVAVPMVMYFTTWYVHVYSSGAVRELTYVVLMVPGFVFFWTLLRVDPVPKAYSYGVAMWITAAEVVGDAFFGLAIIADTGLLAGSYYRGLPGGFGADLASKQVIGGGVIWIIGDMVGLPFLAAQFIQLMREDRDESEAIDAELDAREAALTAASTAAVGEAAVRDPAAPADALDPQKPWWEKDPRFTERFR